MPRASRREEKKKRWKTSNSLKFLTNFRLSGMGWDGMRWDGLGRPTVEEEGSRPPVFGGVASGGRGSGLLRMLFIIYLWPTFRPSKVCWGRSSCASISGPLWWAPWSLEYGRRSKAMVVKIFTVITFFSHFVLSIVTYIWLIFLCL